MLSKPDGAWMSSRLRTKGNRKGQPLNELDTPTAYFPNVARIHAEQRARLMWPIVAREGGDRRIATPLQVRPVALSAHCLRRFDYPSDRKS